MSSNRVMSRWLQSTVLILVLLAGAVTVPAESRAQEPTPSPPLPTWTAGPPEEKTPLPGAVPTLTRTLPPAPDSPLGTAVPHSPLPTPSVAPSEPISERTPLPLLAVASAGLGLAGLALLVAWLMIRARRR